MLLKYRIVGGVGALLLVGAAVAMSSTLGGAAVKNSLSDTVGFSGKAFIAVAPTAAKPGFGSLVAKDCTIKSDGMEPAVSCTLTAAATLTLTGGTRTGSVRSSEGIITFNETFVNTSPTTGTGTGPCTEFDFDDRSSSTCTFTDSFTISPSAVAPNIFVYGGTIIVSDNPNQPGDPDSPPTTTTTVPPTTTTTVAPPTTTTVALPTTTTVALPTTTTVPATTTTVPG